MDYERNLKAIPFIMYDSLMFPFITIGPRRGDGMAGQDGWEGNRRTGGQEEKQEEKKKIWRK